MGNVDLTPQPSPASRHTVAFVGVSVALHAAVGLLWSTPTPHVTGGAATSLTVALAPAPAPLSAAAPPPMNTPPPPRPVTRDANITATRPAASPAPPMSQRITTVVAEPATVPGSPAGGDAESIRTPETAAHAVASTANATATDTAEPRPIADQSLLVGEIKRRMDKHKVFPHVARVRGWQGRVLLAFRIDRRGNIDRIEVAEGSGYSLLDHSAVQALRAIGNLSDADRYLPPESVDLQLPVVYRLTEG